MRRRSTPTPDEQHAQDLLEALIEAPPVRSAPIPRPVTLRSTAEQRRHALSGYLLRTWVDRALQHTEVLLMLAVAAVFGYWLLDGPVRDWWHMRTAPAAPAVAASLPPPTRIIAPTAIVEDQQAAPLPYVTEAMIGSEPEAEFVAPRAAVPLVPQVELAPQPTRLSIPAIGLDTPVREVFVVDGIWEVADYAAGYLHGSGLPGEPGNMALAGHAGLRGAVFRDLGALAGGDDIFVEAAGWRYQYRVRSTTSVWPTQVEVLAPTEEPILTLITCTNWDTQRLIVTAELVGAVPIAGE
jgi:sortase A